MGKWELVSLLLFLWLCFYQKFNLPGDDLFLFNCNEGDGPDSNIDIHLRNFLGLLVVTGEVLFSKLLKSNFRRSCRILFWGSGKDGEAPLSSLFSSLAIGEKQNIKIGVILDPVLAVFKL